MTPKQLQAIRERCEKATPGPWFIDEGVNPPDVQIISENLNYAVCETFNCNIDQLNDADPVFIAHARTDIPALLDEIERCHEVINKLKQDIYQHEFWAEKSVKERERLLGALKTIITIDDRCDSDFEASEDLRKVAEIARQALEVSQ